jgi:hypothetical protein
MGNVGYSCSSCKDLADKYCAVPMQIKSVTGTGLFGFTWNICTMRNFQGLSRIPQITEELEVVSVQVSRLSVSMRERLCMCLDFVSLRDLWMPGKVFFFLLERAALRIFFSYFRLRVEPMMVRNKAANLKLARKHSS